MPRRGKMSPLKGSTITSWKNSSDKRQKLKVGSNSSICRVAKTHRRVARSGKSLNGRESGEREGSGAVQARGG